MTMGRPKPRAKNQCRKCGGSGFIEAPLYFGAWGRVALPGHKPPTSWVRCDRWECQLEQRPFTEAG